MNDVYTNIIRTVSGNVFSRCGVMVQDFNYSFLFSFMKKYDEQKSNYYDNCFDLMKVNIEVVNPANNL
jgi:hypothetical protein